MDINQTVSFFRELSDPDIEEIKSLAIKSLCKKDQLVFSQGDEADSFYIIESGLLSVFYDDKGNKKQLCTLTDDDYFGEMAIYNNDKRSASVIAVEDSILLQVNKLNFLAFVDNHPALKEKLSRNLAIRNEELVLRESLVDITGLNGKRLHVSIKGDPSLRESAFVRERYESIADKALDQLTHHLELLLLNRCVYSVFINFNSGEIRTKSIFDPFVEEIHTADKILERAYLDRHFPEISYDEKASMIKSIYRFISSDHHFNQLPTHWQNIISKSHDNWTPINRDEIIRVMSQLARLRSIQSFYLRNFSISMILDAIRMQFNCDGTHIVSAEDYEQFLRDNLEEEVTT